MSAGIFYGFEHDQHLRKWVKLYDLDTSPSLAGGPGNVYYRHVYGYKVEFDAETGISKISTEEKSYIDDVAKELGMVARFHPVILPDCQADYDDLDSDDENV